MLFIILLFFNYFSNHFIFRRPQKKPQKKAEICFSCGVLRMAQLISFCIMQSEVRLKAASVWSNSATWLSIR